jgi:hypothetical protein
MFLVVEMDVTEKKIRRCAMTGASNDLFWNITFVLLFVFFLNNFLILLPVFWSGKFWVPRSDVVLHAYLTGQTYHLLSAFRKPVKSCGLCLFSISKSFVVCKHTWRMLGGITKCVCAFSFCHDSLRQNTWCFVEVCAIWNLIIYLHVWLTLSLLYVCWINQIVASSRLLVKNILRQMNAGNVHTHTHTHAWEDTRSIPYGTCAVQVHTSEWQTES